MSYLSLVKYLLIFKFNEIKLGRPAQLQIVVLIRFVRKVNSAYDLWTSGTGIKQQFSIFLGGGGGSELGIFPMGIGRIFFFQRGSEVYFLLI